MKPIFVRAAGALALTAAVAACASAPTPLPAPAPARAVQAPAPAPATVQSSVAPVDQWFDAQPTPGNWAYRDDPISSRAEYGAGTAPLFILRCDRSRRQVSIERAAAPAGANQMTIRTQSRTISLSAHPAADGNAIVATLESGDPLLDAMAITRGRFAVEVAGYPALYLPNWAEVARVVEDCR
ncbi:MAG: hypothetical protein WC692_10695 [Erythrobacter sp.]|jgi:hypothetical protein